MALVGWYGGGGGGGVVVVVGVEVEKVRRLR
jgi:hypothetical protein